MGLKHMPLQMQQYGIYLEIYIGKKLQGVYKVSNSVYDVVMCLDNS
jgi:hypothetical protein